MTHLPLIHFSGVLGIQKDTLAFIKAYSYTPLAAGFIWAGRLFLLEYALPVELYDFLGWPSSDH